MDFFLENKIRILFLEKLSPYRISYSPFLIYCNFFKKSMFFYIFRKIHISKMLLESSIAKFSNLAHNQLEPTA